MNEMLSHVVGLTGSSLSFSSLKHTTGMGSCAESVRKHKRSSPWASEFWGQSVSSAKVIPLWALG